MKGKIINIMTTTGITLVVLSIIGILSGGKWLMLNSVFQSLGVNIVIHLGFLLTHKFESKYIILDSIIDVGYTILVLLVFGSLFDWYDSTPIWMLVIMAIVIYTMGFLFNLFRAREEIKKINQLIHKRNSE